MNILFNRLMHLLPDRLYIAIKYFYHFKKLPNLRFPHTFNEKIQWLKLHDRKALYNIMVDKYEAKKYIANIIGDEYVIPAYGVWDKFEDIDFDSLPDKFVLKTTHDCGGIVICKNKAIFDKDKAGIIINKHLNNNFFYEGREWPYKDIKPRILAEKYMENDSTKDLKDYKIFTFNGESKLLFVAADRQNENKETKFIFYDMNFNKLDIENGHLNSGVLIPKPINLNKMKLLANKIAKQSKLKHLRVDFYEVNGRVYIGELTFYHWSGFVPFKPDKWDKILGEWIVLPKKLR